MSDWVRDYFERGYAQRWALGPPSAETPREADALWTHLRLTAGTPLLDTGCGHGRHAVTLARRGANVTGVDFAAQLLTRARQLAKSVGVAVNWVRGDMRCLPVQNARIAAMIMFDAFGFFDREDENQATLHESARVLVPGGRFALKVVNAEPIMRNFRATEREERGSTIVEIARTLLDNPPRLVEELQVSGPRGSGHYQRRQRLYRATDMTTAMEAAGLTIDAVLGEVTGAPFHTETSATMVIIGERAAA